MYHLKTSPLLLAPLRVDLNIYLTHGNCEEDEPPWLTKAAAAVACLRQASANLRAKNARTRGSIGRAHSTLLEEGEDAASVCEHGGNAIDEPVLRSEPLLHASLLLRRLRIRLRISHTFWLPV